MLLPAMHTVLATGPPNAPAMERLARQVGASVYLVRPVRPEALAMALSARETTRQPV